MEKAYLVMDGSKIKSNRKTIHVVYKGQKIHSIQFNREIEKWNEDDIYFLNLLVYQVGDGVLQCSIQSYETLQ